ncbi:MAG: hypothetical protein A2293_08000 [Elusimicrobia bacterium RIFOXYB2_FULL_49_7]|nr:MAG: hypothetical protein A2293_08000 [Elusimicrobia bacterium RIFOXYB2_FULL_49_7]
MIIKDNFQYPGRVSPGWLERQRVEQVRRRKRTWLLIFIAAGIGLMMWWNWADAAHDVAHACAWADKEVASYELE